MPDANPPDPFDPPPTTREFLSETRADIWRQLAEQLHARYQEGNFWSGDRLEARSGPWTITLDIANSTAGTSPVQTTRMRAPFVNKDGLRFTIYPAGALSSLAHALGMQDVEIGDEPFDKRFVIKSNNEAKVKQLLADEDIRRMLMDEPGIRFETRDDEGWFAARFPRGVDELYCEVGRVMHDLPKLKELFELFTETLNRLADIGAADPRDPDVKL